MQVTMQHAERLKLAEMREFLSASNTLSFAGAGRKQIYGLVEGVLRAQKYLGLSRKDKGMKVPVELSMSMPVRQAPVAQSVVVLDATDEPDPRESMSIASWEAPEVFKVMVVKVIPVVRPFNSLPVWPVVSKGSGRYVQGAVAGGDNALGAAGFDVEISEGRGERGVVARHHEGVVGEISAYAEVDGACEGGATSGVGAERDAGA